MSEKADSEDMHCNLQGEMSSEDFMYDKRKVRVGSKSKAVVHPELNFLNLGGAESL